MAAPYHEGELAVQRRAGVQDMARKIGSGIHAEIPAAAREFLRGRRFAVLASVDAAGAVWASLLTGPLGFLDAPDAHTLALTASPAAGDPLAAALRRGAAVGMLAIDFATRRRMRLNGTVVEAAAGTVRVRAAQVYANCPKYIQRRELAADATAPVAPPAVRHGAGLGDAERAWIAAADTFFVASAHPTAGADASHRGGAPGFVHVIDARTLRWPDYAGNTMFQTLGNFAVNPSAGLLFVDFERGATLQLTGRARVLWGDAERAGYAGAERLVEFQVDRWIEIAGNVPRGWSFIDASPFNPA
jgi:hypothetical protein